MIYSKNIHFISISFFTLYFVVFVNCLNQQFQNGRRRKGRTLFHEDQDVLITMIIVFPYYFPLWERFYNTSVEIGTDAAMAQFPNLPPGGLPSCGVFCRKRRSLAQRSGRFFEYDEHIIYFLIELIGAYPVPIIPNPYALANRKPMRKTGFTPLPGLNGLRQITGLFGGMFGSDLGEEDFPDIPPPLPPITPSDQRQPVSSKKKRSFDHELDVSPIEAKKVKIQEYSDENQTNIRNLCISSDYSGFQSRRSLKENCFLNKKNSHILSAYETVTIDRKRMISTMKLNWSSLMSTVSCHFTEWYLKTKINFFVRNFFYGSLKTICGNTNLVMFFTVLQKYCKCLILKKLI